MARNNSISWTDLAQAGVDEAYLEQRYGDAYRNFTPSTPTKKVEEFITQKLNQEEMTSILAEKRIEREFDTVVGTLTTRLQTNIRNINQARDDLLVTAMIQAGVNGTYLQGRYGQRYIDFKKPDGTDYTPAEEAQKVEAFIRGKDATGRYFVPIDDKLAIIAERTNNDQIFAGTDKLSADLADVQKIKDANKRTYRQQAEEIIQYLEGIVTKNAELISQLNDRVLDHQRQLDELRAKPIPGPSEQTTMGANGTVVTAKRTQQDVDNDKARKDEDIRKLERMLRQERAELERLRREHNLYVAECAKRKNELNEMLNEGKIFSGSEQQGNTPQNGESPSQTTDMTTTQTLSTPKAIARSMLQDFFDRSPEEQRTILAQCGSKDILNATRYLGVMQRRKLARVLEERIGEMGSKTLDFGMQDAYGNPRVLTSNALLQGNLSKADLDQIAKYIRDFNNNFRSKTPEEIAEFEDKIQYVRYATYMLETRWFRTFARPFDMFNKNFKIGELAKTLARYATIKNERERNQVARLNKWRTTLKLGPVHELSVTNPEELDRTGQAAIHRQDYHQDSGTR